VGFVVLGGVNRAGAERESIGDGVEAAVTERIASQNPPGSEQKASQDAEALDGLERVSGTSGLVTAAARESR
jgi:hypothetical protein